MQDNVASDLKNCDEEVPLLGVTREFDFGQFIELFEDSPAPNDPNTPVISRIVIRSNSQLAIAQNPATASSSSAITAADPNVAPFIIENGSRSGSVREPEVHLFDLAEHGPGIKREPVNVDISRVGLSLQHGTFQVEGHTYQVELDAATSDAIQAGMVYTTFARSVEGNKEGLPVRLSRPFETVKLTEAVLAKVLSGERVESSFGQLRPALNAGAIRTLLSGGLVLTHGVGADGRKTPIALRPPNSKTEPLSDRFEIFDVASFMANPAVFSQTGERIPLKLAPENAQELISSGRTRLQVQGRPVDFSVVEDGLPPMNEGLPITIPGVTKSEFEAYVRKLSIQPYLVHPRFPDRDSGLELSYFDGTTGGGGTGGKPNPSSSMINKVQPRLPNGSGLPVAVFVPWKQTWTLKGFSRGNLLQTIAMAPQEQITMQVLSWERRSRSLDQSSETDVDQQTDVNQTTRDTEDVFKEMISKHDFAWQISGSIDASYSPGVASIKVSAGGGVSETNNIVQTARRSSQSVKESTIKASSRVRSRRVTRIIQTVESGREERVTRVIRNPNQCHTLTLDFFETLAHYEIKLEFLKDRLRLVVLVPNPINVPDFVSEIIRRNETALRNALIDPALDDGFEACRFVAAYLEAKDIVSIQKAEAVKVEELDAQRDKPAQPNMSDPAAPQQAEVERVVGEMISALKNVKSGAEIDTALAAIRDHKPVSEAARRTGQQWLFINFCSNKLPALFNTLDALADAAASLPAAQKVMAVLPKPDAPTNLGNLNQMSNAEKEVCGIASKLREADSNRQRIYMKMDHDWGWWSGRLQEEGLYMANDGGLAGLADQLQKAYVAWEAKKAQGAAMKDQDVAKTEAEGKQDKANADDKLAMAFPLEELARAYERMKILMSHLNEHRPFYNYALFQSLPPSEQTLKIVEASNGRLQVGLFEPRVVAMNGTRLVVPLTPLATQPPASTTLETFMKELANKLDDAFKSTLNTPDAIILPTPGVSISSRLGKCSCCEEYLEKAREHELTRLEGLARQEQAEADRREGRLSKNDFEDFRQPPPTIKLDLDKG